jgi:hypothetical protein
MLFCALDTALTLHGQSPAYWAGNYRVVNELSPTFNHLLQIHPAAFLAGMLAWMGAFVGILLLLPDTLALIVSLAVTYGHTAGAISWIHDLPHGYQLANGLFLLAAVVLGVAIRWGWQARPKEEYRLAFLPAPVRWLLIAVLFGVGVYLFLWPRGGS